MLPASSSVVLGGAVLFSALIKLGSVRRTVLPFTMTFASSFEVLGIRVFAIPSRALSLSFEAWDLRFYSCSLAYSDLRIFPLNVVYSSGTSL